MLARLDQECPLKTQAPETMALTGLHSSQGRDSDGPKGVKSLLQMNHIQAQEGACYGV